MEELINVMDTDAKNNLQNLKDISTEEDNIIESLEYMDKQLDKYLQLANHDNLNQPQTDYLYASIKNTNDMVESIQQDLDSVENKIIQPLNNDSTTFNQIKFENDKNPEAIKLDVKRIIIIS